jgi:ubiquinone/menaquinone biosynthesis C-methylase UbiE
LSFEKYFWGDIDLNGKTILDVAAGKGATTVKILEKMVFQKANGTVIAVEILRNSLKLAKENITRLPYKIPVMFIMADSAYLPLRAECVDLVFSNRAIADMNSPPCRIVRILAELRRVLRRGGKVVLSDECPFVKRPEGNEMASWRWKIAKAISHLIGREHAHEVDPKDLEFIMKLIGFKEVQSRTFKGEPLTPRRMQRFIQNSLDLIGSIDDLELRRALLRSVKKAQRKFRGKYGLSPPRYVLQARK